MSHSYALICPMRTMIHMILNEGILGYTAPFSRNWVSTEVDWHLAQLAEPLWTPVTQREPGTAQHGLTAKKWIVQSVVHKATRKMQIFESNPNRFLEQFVFSHQPPNGPHLLFLCHWAGRSVLRTWLDENPKWLSYSRLQMDKLQRHRFDGTVNFYKKTMQTYCFTFHVFHVLGGCPANFTQKSGEIPEISGPAAVPRAAARPRLRPVRPPVSSAKALRMMWGGTEMEMCTGHMCKYNIYIYIWYIIYY